MAVGPYSPEQSRVFINIAKKKKKQQTEAVIFKGSSLGLCFPLPNLKTSWNLARKPFTSGGGGDAAKRGVVFWGP